MDRIANIRHILVNTAKHVSCLVALAFCGCHPVGGIVPPDRVIFISTFYSTASGENLLDPTTPGAFKADEIKVESIEEINGIKKTIMYDEVHENEIGIDPDTGTKCLFLTLPTNAFSNPIMTLVHLNPTVTDTITSIFVAGKYGYMPEKIFYNKALVWDIVNAKPDGSRWPPIKIVK